MPILRQCENCGAEFKIKPSRLKTGRGKYCSQACKTLAAESGLRQKHLAEYNCYQVAKSRCTNRNHRQWERYGGRGIEFKFASFDEFIKHVGARPEGLSIDRIDNDGDYEPGNVRWADRQTQNSNRRPPSSQVDKLLRQLRSSPQ